MLLLGLAAALPCPAAAQETAELRDWWAACDPQRTCWAFGFSEDGAEQSGFVRIARSGASGAAPEVIIGPSLWEEQAAKPGSRVRATVDGKVVATAVVTADSYAPVSDAKAARALIAAMRDGRRMTLQFDGGGEPAEVSLNGAAAALLWLDDRQKRAGTVTALARPGGRPASAVPPVPSAKVVRRAASVRQGQLPTALPASALARPEVKACREEIQSEEMRAPDVARLDVRTLLWGVPCLMGAYQGSSLFFLSDERGRGWRPAPFEPPASADEGYVTTPSFDAETMTLSSWAKGRGLGDCGSSREWTWTGRAFVLTREVYMGPCRAVPHDLWPETMKAEVRR
jgi:hypothetical protein